MLKAYNRPQPKMDEGRVTVGTGERDDGYFGWVACLMLPELQKPVEWPSRLILPESSAVILSLSLIFGDRRGGSDERGNRWRRLSATPDIQP